MTITREDVADLREGDVVEITEIVEGDVYTHRGPVRADAPTRPSSLNFADLWLRNEQGEPGGWIDTLTVVSRAFRLYVNHPRTEPVPGDVVGDGDGETGRTWAATGGRWRRTTTGVLCDRSELPARLRLLIDGETGMTVPS